MRDAAGFQEIQSRERLCGQAFGLLFLTDEVAPWRSALNTFCRLSLSSLKLIVAGYAERVYGKNVKSPFSCSFLLFLLLLLLRYDAPADDA